MIEIRYREQEARESLTWYGAKSQKPYKMKPETWERILFCGWLHKFFPEIYDVTFASGNDIYLDLLETPSQRKRRGNVYRSAGMKKGIPDLIILYPSRFYHGCLIEMKRLHGGKATKEQLEMCQRFRDHHYYVQVCYGFQNAAKAILRYLYDYN